MERLRNVLEKRRSCWIVRWKPENHSHSKSKPVPVRFLFLGILNTICFDAQVYQKAVITPMLNIETLWKDYLAYEHAINPIIAEKMLMERSKDYMNARRVAKELEIIIRGLSKNYPSIPPTGSAEEAKQVYRAISPRKSVVFGVTLTWCNLTGGVVEKIYFVGKKQSFAFGRYLVGYQKSDVRVRAVSAVYGTSSRFLVRSCAVFGPKCQNAHRKRGMNELNSRLGNT